MLDVLLLLLFDICIIVNWLVLGVVKLLECIHYIVVIVRIWRFDAKWRFRDGCANARVLCKADFWWLWMLVWALSEILGAWLLDFSYWRLRLVKDWRFNLWFQHLGLYIWIIFFNLGLLLLLLFIENIFLDCLFVPFFVRGLRSCSFLFFKLFFLALFCWTFLRTFLLYDWILLLLV